jgi:hypothetical protein
MKRSAITQKRKKVFCRGWQWTMIMIMTMIATYIDNDNDSYNDDDEEACHSTEAGWQC